VTITGMGLLFWSVTLAQSLEAVTRVYYERSDLDLVLSSPASSHRLFAVRAGAVFTGTASLGALLITPIVVALALQDGPHWLAAYAVLLSLAALSTALALGVTRLLFRLVGAKRTRLIAQILAGIVGAGFAIGMQAAAILSHEGFSRFAILQSDDIVSRLPDTQNPLWWSARAALGDPGLATLILAVAAAVLALAIALIAPSYGTLATSAASVAVSGRRHRPARTAFRALSQRQALRRKEWTLLARDPWLLSQTLTQLFYLLPPALLLWVNWGSGAGVYIVIVPVLVMAAGQLSGGIAWLAISGEDAHGLIDSAPLTGTTVLRAKVEAVLTVIAAVLAPIVLLLALSSPTMALITAICGILAAAGATTIQLWFRMPTRRAMFRRRQVASRAATLCEAFSSIMWAGTAALLAAGTYVAILPAVIALLVLGLARLIAPRQTR
jgi:ABC-2 type transport system permease protein